MKLEITIDESILKELVLPSVGNQERMNVNTRVARHIIVGSPELRRQWLMLLENDDFFKRHPLMREVLEDWLTKLVTDKKKYKAVNVSEPSKVQGNPAENQVAQLEAAYESASKIVIGDFPDELRRANPDLKFVSRVAFAKDHPSSITMKQVHDVLDGTSNRKDHIFAVFETPIQLDVHQKSSAALLAKYLAHFYDDTLVIQDEWFLKDKQNRENFETYILPYVDRENCRIVVRAKVNQQLAQSGSVLKRKYERMIGYTIRIQCIEEGSENLHRGYFESSKYRILVPYRLFVFGTHGENSPDTVSIFKK